MEHATNRRLAFCTLGMLIIDEIDYGEGRDKQENILGGAGAYAALGARLAAGQRNAHLVSWIIDRGSDFPDELMSIIDSWGTNCVFRTDVDRLTTRAWNGYGPGQNRAFKYLTPKQRLEERDLNDDQVGAASIHMVCSPTRCIDLCSGIYNRRLKLANNASRWVKVWEPVPDLCTPEELINLQRAVERVEVVSPNGEEFSSFFKGQSPAPDRRAMVEQVLGRYLGSGDAFPAFVIREGADGSYLFFGDHRVHFRAYHQNSANVVDPTGGGNTFLGALAIALAGKSFPEPKGLLSSLKWNIKPRNPQVLDDLEDFLCAVAHATIAASFAIEQVGMPKLVPDQSGIWNRDSYTRRFYEYLVREGSYLIYQLNKSWIPGTDEWM